MLFTRRFHDEGTFPFNTRPLNTLSVCLPVEIVSYDTHMIKITKGRARRLTYICLKLIEGGTFPFAEPISFNNYTLFCLQDGSEKCFPVNI